MRLSNNEANVIRTLLCQADPRGKIYLFGSRADDTRRGGDIDIFFETSLPLGLRNRLLLEYKLSSEVNTKVDLLVKAPNEEEQPIYAIARKGVVL